VAIGRTEARMVGKVNGRKKKKKKTEDVKMRMFKEGVKCVDQNLQFLVIPRKEKIHRILP
jgi:hypothetical protein